MVSGRTPHRGVLPLTKKITNDIGLLYKLNNRIFMEHQLFIGLWTNLKQKMDERAIRGEKISDMRNRSTDDLGVRK
jgi:hypothetical protein